MHETDREELVVHNASPHTKYTIVFASVNPERGVVAVQHGVGTAHAGASQFINLCTSLQPTLRFFEADD